jgi:hypothetical protein
MRTGLLGQSCAAADETQLMPALTKSMAASSVPDGRFT